ncbi:TPA: benzoylformate decarboxylase, partial [Escherichia coli]|nr:benzoylformate decarboxylase [Escherichia coli]
IVNLSKKLSAAKNPVMILGPQVDNYLGWQGAISLSEKLCLPVFIAPSPSRCPFPTKHHNYLGILPSGIQDVAEKLSEYDFIISFGTAIFRYHEYQEGDYLYSNSELWAITSDPDEGSRSPVGNVIIGETSDALFRISEIVEPTKDYVCINPPTEDANSDYLDLARYSSEGFSKEDILDAISYAKKNDTIIVNEWTSSDNCWDRLDISQPGSLFFPAAGGLGWGLPAAIGFQIGCADRRVIAILGDGAFQYSISALWTAAKYNIPVVFIVANNSCYGALHKFSTLMDKSGIPGLDIPNIDILNIASGYGINSKRVNSLYDFVTTIKSALEANKPFLIEITQKDW